MTLDLIPALTLPKIAPMVALPTTLPAAIITPVYGQAGLTMRYVTSLREWVLPPHRLVIVDNGSPDQTGSFLKSMQRAHFNLDIVSSKTNLGFSGGNNLGVQHSMNVAVYIFMSNDVVADGDFITPVCEALERDPYQLIGKEMHSHDTGWNTYYRDGRERITIPYIQGYFVAVHAKAFPRLMAGEGRQAWELWDPHYFPADCEDLDVAYRALLNSIKLTVLPSLPVRHDGSGHTANHMLTPRYESTLKNQRYFMGKFGLTL